MTDASPHAANGPAYLALYARAFDAYGSATLWNKARLEHPGPEHALVIARALRVEGDRHARQLAEDIEQAVKVAHGAAL